MTNLDEMLAWLDAPRAAQEETDEGKEAFALTCKIFEHDAIVRRCTLRPEQSEKAQIEHMQELASTRADLVQRLDALCSGKATNMPAQNTISDQLRLATRGELIAAFGAFSGMDESWFANVKDSPRLLAARKITGHGGRRRLREPMFCPLEVMLWIVDPARRKGRKVSVGKGWELLEKHFPLVYAANSVADPRTPT